MADDLTTTFRCATCAAFHRDPDGAIPPGWTSDSGYERPDRYWCPTCSARRREKLPERGEVYRHYKGGEYRVLAQACLEATPEVEVVVYEATANGSVWVRPLRGPSGWLTPTEDGRARFARKP